MKKLLLTWLIICTITQGLSQVGIRTTDPKATLDIVALNSTGSSTNVDGIIIPRVDRQRAQSMVSIETSTIIYINDETTGTATGIASDINQKGFYYYDGAKWVKFSLSASTAIDIGYIVGWSASTTPPDYLLPISGGTYNWTDYPDLKTLNTTHPNQFIQSSTATTFTLKDINTNGKFLRGSSTAGTSQSQTTALPTTSFVTSTTGDHSHTVDPAAVTTTSDGSHTHSSNASGTPGSYGLIRRSLSGENNTASAFDNGGSGNEADLIGTINGLGINAAGVHSHTVDVLATTSTTAGSHSHTVTGGGDTETRPTNISVVWCLKAKSTSTSGNITINNGNVTALTTLGTSGPSTLSGGVLNIPQYTSSIYGDIKTGIQSTDHNGWIKLNGRLKSSLTPTQQTNATALGIGTNLPDATDAHLIQNGGTLGTISGSNTTTIAQNQLPNVGIGIPAHSHTAYDYYISTVEAVGGYDTDATIGIPYNNNWSWRMKMNESGVEGLKFYGTERSYSTSGTSLTTYSINGNVAQGVFDKTPKSLSVNTFIYLGN